MMAELCRKIQNGISMAGGRALFSVTQSRQIVLRVKTIDAGNEWFKLQQQISREWVKVRYSRVIKIQKQS